MKTPSYYALAILALFMSALTVSADIPSEYYNSLNGKRDAELKTATFNIIHNFTSVSSYNNLPSYFRQTDVRPGTEYWWDMYSDMEVDIHIQFGTYMNREHSFPKSWWGSTNSTATNYKAYTDLNHLYPGEAKANQAKSNYPLGEVRTANKFDNGVTKVGSPASGQGGGAAYVFEPDNEYKGDFARTYFYMVTCYQDYKWATNYMYMLQQNTYPTLNTWSVDLLLKWARQDPVSDKERNRNEQVYKIQNNRNPFIDFPELAEYIWGNKKGEIFYVSSSTPPAGDALLLAPVENTTVDFGQVAVGNSTNASLLIRGENLRKAITMFIFSGDKSAFNITTTSVPANLVNGKDGYNLNITYKPTTTGIHESKLQLVCDDIDSAPPVVTLRGECLENPILTACTALDPTDITSDEYSANWSSPDGEVIDYWIITRTKYTAGGASEVEEILAESSPWTITGFNNSDYETYAVQSVRLNERSPMSNTVVVRHSGITGVECDRPLSVKVFDGFIRFECDDPQTNCRVFDITGRQVMSIDRIELDLEVEMPLGVYFITTDQHPTPVKVAVR